MLMDAVHGFGSAFLMLMIASAIVMAGWVASMFRDRSRDLLSTYRTAAVVVVLLALVAALLVGAGQRVQVFFYVVTLVGAPVMVGLAPRGWFARLVGREEEPPRP